VLDDIVSRGADVANVRVVSAVCAPPALKLLGERFPGLKIYTGVRLDWLRAGVGHVLWACVVGMVLHLGTSWGQHAVCGLQECLGTSSRRNSIARCAFFKPHFLKRTRFPRFTPLQASSTQSSTLTGSSSPGWVTRETARLAHSRAG
jgi:hypothetical protein